MSDTDQVGLLIKVWVLKRVLEWHQHSVYTTMCGTEVWYVQVAPVAASSKEQERYERALTHRTIVNQTNLSNPHTPLPQPPIT